MFATFKNLPVSHVHIIINVTPQFDNPHIFYAPGYICRKCLFTPFEDEALSYEIHCDVWRIVTVC